MTASTVSAASTARTPSALGVPAFRRLWLGGVTIFLAVTSGTVARAWVAYDLTGSNAGLGGVMLGFGIAMLVATPLGGVAADRYNRQRIVAACAALLAVSSLLVGVAIVADVIAYWILVLASALQAVGFAFFGPARLALTAEVVSGPQLPNAIVLSQMSLELTRVLGPASAGVLVGVAWVGAGGVFLIGAVVSFISVPMFLSIPHQHIPVGRSTSGLKAVVDAVRHIRESRERSALVITTLLVVVVAFPYMTFLPALASDVFGRGSGTYGLMSAVSAVGAVLTGWVAVRAVSDGWTRMVVSGGAFVLALTGVALAPTLWVALPLLCMLGGATLMFQTAGQALLVQISAAEFQGRVQSTVMMGFAGFGIAALPIGLIADMIGLRATFLGMAAVAGLAVIWFAVGVRRRR